MLSGLTLHNLYQLGYVARDVDQAVDYFRKTFGIENFRILRRTPDIATAHAYVGDIMLELIAVTKNGPAQFVDYIPEDPQVAQFHHHAYRIGSEEEWEALSRTIKGSGLKYYQSASMNGGMNVFFVDLRPLTGVYAEYVYTKGDALTYYDDVPRN